MSGLCTKAAMVAGTVRRQGAAMSGLNMVRPLGLLAPSYLDGLPEG